MPARLTQAVLENFTVCVCVYVWRYNGFPKIQDSNSLPRWTSGLPEVVFPHHSFVENDILHMSTKLDANISIQWLDVEFFKFQNHSRWSR